MNRRMTCLIFLVLLVLPLTASAQDAPATGDIVKLNEEGITAYQSGNFEEAATKFQQAYQIEPTATLKKNEAVAWFKAGKCAPAVTAGKQFLGLPDTDELSQVEARAIVLQCDMQLARSAVDAGELDEAEARVADARANEPDPQALEELTKLDEAIAARRQEQAEAARKAMAAEEARRQAELAASRSDTKTTLGMGMIAGGGAVVLGTLVYHAVMLFSVAPKFRDAAAAGSNRADYDRMGKRLETANWLVPTLYGVGAATAGVGIYFWMQGSNDNSDVTTATGSNRPTDFGVRVGWRF